MKIGGLERILRKSALVVAGGCLLFNLFGCSKNGDDSPTAPVNQAPEIYITEGPSNGEEVNDNSVEFGWLGFDPDGGISMYKYKLDPTMNNYQETANTSYTFTNLGSGPYVFSVFARDNDGLWSLESAERNFSVYKEYTLTLQPGPEGIDAYAYGFWENGEPTEWCDENFNDYFILVGYYGWTSGSDFFEERGRGYIKSDLDSIPNNANTLNAILRLYAVDVSGMGGVDIHVQKVDSLWVENEITWNNQPSSGSYIYDTQTILEAERFYDFDVIDLVNDWLNGYNNGLVLKSPYEWGEIRSCNFYSSDYNNDISKRPKLEIKYTINQ